MIKRMWDIKESAEPGTLNMYIYGDVEGDAYDWWTDEVIKSETSANYFREELAKYENINQINIYINSYGGSVFEGTAIYNQLKRHPAHKTVYIDGFACSIASVIAMAGDEIIMPRNTMMMIHNMWMYAAGNASELRKAADDLDTINAAGRAAYLLKAGDKLEESVLSEMMDSETWLTASQCIQYGLADKLSDSEADLSSSGGILQKLNKNLEQKINMHKSLNEQLRQLTEPRNGEMESDPVSVQEKEKEPDNIMNVLCGFFNVKKEENK